MQRNQAASPFLRLPPEIRNRIYTYIFGDCFVTISSHAISPDSRRVYGRFEAFEPPGYLDPCPEINYGQAAAQTLLVCRQIYSEARLLPFVLNTFYYHTVEDLEFWKAQMSAQLSAVRKLWFEEYGVVPSPSNSQLKLFLAALPALVHITVCINNSEYMDSPLTTTQQEELDEYERHLKTSVEEMLGCRADIRFDSWNGWVCLCR